MATIGTFTKSSDTFSGSVKTLSINAKTTIKTADKASDKAPDYRIFAGSVEFGAAWKKTSGEGRGVGIRELLRASAQGFPVRDTAGTSPPCRTSGPRRRRPSESSAPCHWCSRSDPPQRRSLGRFR